MKVIILGAGSVGIQIARQLIAEGRDVVLIDRDEETTKDVVNNLDCMVINGEASKKDTLIQAGADKADVFISVTDSDELNIVACSLVGTDFGVKQTIARVRSEEYTEAITMGQGFMGIHHVINPDVEAAQAILRTIEYGVTSDILQFPNSNYEMRSTIIQDYSPGVNKNLMDIKQEAGRSFLVAIIIRDGSPIIPTGSTIVARGDVIYLVGTGQELEMTLGWLGKTPTMTKNILMVGGGRVPTYLLRGLSRGLQELHPSQDQGLFSRLKGILRPQVQKTSRSITLIEADRERSEELSRMYPGIMVKHADVAEDPVLEEDDLTRYDLLITATDNQELNLVTALYGKSLGTPRTIALVRKNSYLTIASHLTIDATISLNNTIVNSILKLVRKGNIRSVHSLAEGKIEFVEITCQKGDKFDSRAIKDLKLPKDTLILFITRDKQNLLPSGNLVILAGDNLVIITTGESMKKLENTLGKQ